MNLPAFLLLRALTATDAELAAWQASDKGLEAILEEPTSTSDAEGAGADGAEEAGKGSKGGKKRGVPAAAAQQQAKRARAEDGAEGSGKEEVKEEGSEEGKQQAESDPLAQRFSHEVPLPPASAWQEPAQAGDAGEAGAQAGMRMPHRHDPSTTFLWTRDAAALLALAVSARLSRYVASSEDAGAKGKKGGKQKQQQKQGKGSGSKAEEGGSEENKGQSEHGSLQADEAELAKLAEHPPGSDPR